MRVLMIGLLCTASAAPLWGQAVNLLPEPESRVASREMLALLTSTGLLANLDTAMTATVMANATPKNEVAVSAGANANTDEEASGIIGLQYWKEESFMVRVQFNLGEATVVAEDPGAAGDFLLSPGFQGRGGSGMFTATMGRLGSDARLALTGGAGLSFADWQTTVAMDDGMGGTTTVTSSVDGFVFYADVALQLVSRNLPVRNNLYAVGLELGLAHRTFGGSIGQDDAFRAMLYGSSDKSFTSIEGTLFLRLDNVAPFLRVANYGASGGGQIRAFTDLQAYIGVDLAASLFRDEVGS